MKNIFSLFSKKEPTKVPSQPDPYIICKEVTMYQREIIWKLVEEFPDVVVNEESKTPYATLVDAKWSHFFLEETPLKIIGVSHIYLFDKKLNLGLHDYMVEINFTEFIERIFIGIWKMEEEIRMAEYRKNNP